MATTCYETRVINTSGKVRSFGFLGKHGRRLDINEQYAEPGDILEKLRPNRRKFDALMRAIGGAAPALAIIQTPSPTFFDVTAGRAQILNVDGGTLTAVDPCTGAYDTTLTGAFTAIADTAGAVATATLTFSNPVTGFTGMDLRLTLDAVNVAPLTGVTVASADGGRTWTVSGLAAHTAVAGAYVLRVESTDSGIQDQFGNALGADISEGWSKTA